MARKPNSDIRRAEIVTAMQAAIAKYGYEKATVQVVAKEASLAPGLIHYHFKNKQQILIALVTSLVDFANARFESIAQESHDPMSRLHAYLKARLALGQGADAERVAAWVMIGAEAVRQPEVRDVYQEAIEAEFNRLTGLIAACLTAQKRKSKRATELAAAVLAMMEGAYQLASSTKSVMPKGYAARMAIQFIEQSMHSDDN